MSAANAASVDPKGIVLLRQIPLRLLVSLGLVLVAGGVYVAIPALRSPSRLAFFELLLFSSGVFCLRIYLRKKSSQPRRAKSEGRKDEEVLDPGTQALPAPKDVDDLNEAAKWASDILPIHPCGSALERLLDKHFGRFKEIYIKLEDPVYCMKLVAAHRINRILQQSGAEQSSSERRVSYRLNKLSEEFSMFFVVNRDEIIRFRNALSSRGLNVRVRLLEDEPITALLLEDFLENVGFSVRRIPIPEEIAMDLSEERDVDLEPLTLLDVEYEGPHYKPSSRPLFPLALSKRNPYIFREVLGDVSDFATNDFWLALGKFAGHVASVGVFLKSHRV